MDTKETSDTPSNSYHLSLPELLEKSFAASKSKLRSLAPLLLDIGLLISIAKKQKKQKNVASNEFKHSSRA